MDTKTTFTPDEQATLQAEVQAIAKADGLPISAIAKEVGVAYGTFHAWASGTYAGDNDRVAAAASRWLQARQERAQTRAVLPPAPAFTPTATAEQILALLQFCHHAPDQGVIAGQAGIGKTTSIHEYQRRAPNVFILTAEPVSRSPHAVLFDLAEVIGVVERATTRLSRAIQNRLRNAGALIIVDEAQHLPTATLEQLRSIHDLARCGMVFCGNQSVYSRLAGGGKPEFAQLFSRVGKRITQDKPRDEDVVAIAGAWGLGGEAELKILRAIARKPGALRGVTKTVRLAHMIAGGLKEAVTERHLRAAWRDLTAESLDAAAA